ncbi:hypothetical protein [Magnetospirillum sp. SS-4]|uniref:hypothetical protein n=1 Tax=Magnetospirillum sp. SS-4 TaxID=2681465 RepID=UPI00137F3994|nr:hypothetical protein [Magnetospirillum sp. SS-4]CAA7625934.1 hypothetical protein MTBSS4_550011 [Magnetospirillum sp. SS-4]
MANVKTIGRLNRLFLHEKIVTEARDKTPEAAELKEFRREMAEWLQRIGKSGDLDLIVAAERRFVTQGI